MTVVNQLPQTKGPALAPGDPTLVQSHCRPTKAQEDLAASPSCPARYLSLDNKPKFLDPQERVCPRRHAALDT